MSRPNFHSAYRVLGPKDRRRGTASVEFAIMLGLITVVLISTVQELGSRMRSSFDRVLSGNDSSPEPGGQSSFSHPPVPSPQAIPPVKR
jgi:Flp pilus assembly pilin Flp